MRDKVKACVLTVISIFISVVIFYPFLFLLSSFFLIISFSLTSISKEDIQVILFISYELYTKLFLSNSAFLFYSKQIFFEKQKYHIVYILDFMIMLRLKIIVMVLNV